MSALGAGIGGLESARMNVGVEGRGRVRVRGRCLDRVQSPWFILQELELWWDLLSLVQG